MCGGRASFPTSWASTSSERLARRSIMPATPTMTRRETTAYVPKLLRTAAPLCHPGPAVMGHDHAFLARLTERVPKVTIPAPSRFHFQYGVSSLDPADLSRS